MSSTVLRLITLFYCLLFSFSSHSNTNTINDTLVDQRQHQAIILQYHHVSETTPPSTSLAPDTFITHLDLITELGFDVQPLDKVLAHIKSNTPFQQKTLAITFDDGYDSIYQAAYPALKARQWPFTVFISPQAIDKKHGDTMTWEQLKEMEQHGAIIANHSFEHLHLLQRINNEDDAQWAQRITNDITQAQLRLEEAMGPRLKLFAYPYGEFDEALKGILKEEGYIAFSQQSGGINSSNDLQALPRFPASGIYANTKTLKTKINSLAFDIIRYSPEHKVRSSTQKAPKLTLISKPYDIRYKQTQCFYAGQVIPTSAVLKNGELIIESQFEGTLSAGRSRYNCTAPSINNEGYYWFSMPFIALNDEKQWKD